MEGKVSDERVAEIILIMDSAMAERRIRVAEGETPPMDVWTIIKALPEYDEDLSTVADMASRLGAFALVDGTVIATTGHSWYVADERHLR